MMFHLLIFLFNTNLRSSTGLHTRWSQRPEPPSDLPRLLIHSRLPPIPCERSLPPSERETASQRGRVERFGPSTMIKHHHHKLLILYGRADSKKMGQARFRRPVVNVFGALRAGVPLMATAPCPPFTNIAPIPVVLVVAPAAALAAPCCTGGGAVAVVAAAGEGFSGRRCSGRRRRRRSHTGRQPGPGDDLVALGREIPVFSRERNGEDLCTSGFELCHPFTGACGEQNAGPYSHFGPFRRGMCFAVPKYRRVVAWRG